MKNTPLIGRNISKFLRGGFYAEAYWRRAVEQVYRNCTLY